MAIQTSRRLPIGRSLIGAFVVLAGVLLLLDTTGTVPTRNLLIYVPSLFVFAGVWSLVASRFRNLLGPLVLIAVAGAGQLIVLGYATLEQVAVYWPLLLIAGGLSIASGRFSSEVSASDAAYTSAFAAFGGVEKRNTSRTFSGGDLIAVFGGTELDLRDAGIGATPATIDAIALFGGVDVVVPRDWNVRMDVVPLFGGATDDRPRRERTHEETDLVVTGVAAFGAVSITD